MNLPEAPARDPRLRRHNTKTMLTARRMYGNGNSWTPTQIKDYLAARGIKVSLHTVRLWVIPGMADEHRAKNRESYHRRSTNRPKPTPPSKTPVLDRMAALRGAGVSFSAIAAVIGLDLGIQINSDQVRYYLHTGREPVQPKKRAAA